MTQHERRLFDQFADRYLGGDGILFLTSSCKKIQIQLLLVMIISNLLYIF